MQERNTRYIIETRDGINPQEQHYTDDQGFALRLAVILADRDGLAHIIDRHIDNETGTIRSARGYLLSSNT